MFLGVPEKLWLVLEPQPLFYDRFIFDVYIWECEVLFLTW